MSLSFDNDGPTVHIKKINLKEFEIEKSKFSGKAFFSWRSADNPYCIDRPLPADIIL